MTDPIARIRELLAAATRLASAIEGDVRAGNRRFIPPDNQEGLFASRRLLYVVRDSAPVLVEAPTLLAELADACEAKDAEIERLRGDVDTLLAEREMVARCEPYREHGACYCSTGIGGPCAALSDTGGEG